MAGLLSLDNLLIFGAVGGAAAYLTDFGGFKGTVNGWIDGLNLNMSYDPLVPDEAAAVEGGNEGGVGLDEPVAVETPKPAPQPIQGSQVTAGRWSEDNFMFGGFEYPSEEAFDMNNYYPIEGSIEGIAPELKEYTMLIPKWNIMPDVRGLNRTMADDIEYQMG